MLPAADDDIAFVYCIAPSDVSRNSTVAMILKAIKTTQSLRMF